MKRLKYNERSKLLINCFFMFTLIINNGHKKLLDDPLIEFTNDYL